MRLTSPCAGATLQGPIMMLDPRSCRPRTARPPCRRSWRSCADPTIAGRCAALCRRRFSSRPTMPTGVTRSWIMSAAPHVVSEAYAGIADFDVRAASARISVPMLYIAANEPPPRSDVVALGALFPAMQVGRTVGSGPFCQLEVPVGERDDRAFRCPGAAPPLTKRRLGQGQPAFQFPARASRNRSRPDRP